MNYGVTLKKHIKNTIISVVIVGVLLYVRTMATQDFIKIINILIILFSIVLVINIFRWIS